MLQGTSHLMKLFSRSNARPHWQSFHWRRRIPLKRNFTEMIHVDKWFESIVKPPEFYSRHSEGHVRRYFYNIDLQGRLFLEETLPKNIATSIKDEKFLNFFFSRIQRLRDEDFSFLSREGIESDYPFVSLCGKEVNFIRPAATPIVFHSLLGKNLYFGGNLSVPFQASKLAVSSLTGHLYHKIERNQSRILLDGEGNSVYGLIRSSVAVTLSENIYPGQLDGIDKLWITDENGEELVIDSLPLASEPGNWALHRN